MYIQYLISVKGNKATCQQWRDTFQEAWADAKPFVKSDSDMVTFQRMVFNEYGYPQQGHSKNMKVVFTVEELKQITNLK